MFCAMLFCVLPEGYMSVQTITAQAVKDKFILVIDAGHGGHDSGAIGRISREKTINLSVAKAFGKLVEEHCSDVKVVYTRKSDVFVPLGKRAEIANKADADLFVSIHTNALPGKKVGRGAETYTLGMARADDNLEVAKRENSVILVEEDYKERYQGFDPKSSESYIIFELMQDQYMAQSVDFARQIQTEFRTTARRKDKGVHQAGFLVLRETSMPSVLVELGYISTQDEEKFLCSQNGIDKMSRSIYNAFCKYCKQHRKSGSRKVIASNSGVRQASTKVPVSSNVASPKAKSNQEKNVKGSKSAQIVFKIQLIASSRQIPAGSSRFKGLSPVDVYKENGMYKYTYGETKSYNEAVRMRDKIKKDFEGLFIVAFKNGKKINLQEAITESKQNK